MYTLYIYIHMYACIILCGYLPNPLYRGPTAPSDKCLAISSANDVKRAKFMFQHDIDIFLYTDMYIHSPIQKHIMYVFTTSFVACACLRFSRLSQCECIFALWQGEGDAAHATWLTEATSEVKWPSNVLCRAKRGTTRPGIGWTITYTDSWERHDN